MIQLYDTGVYLIHGKELIADNHNASAAMQRLLGRSVLKEDARKGQISFSILEAHNNSLDSNDLQLVFDSLTSHDITYVGIIQTARASGMTEFTMPYVLTNCHNSLCAVGGTINEDDHMFALSAAKKYGGIYVPANLAVIHSYNREMMAGGGRMILGSDSHTRYGALGTMAVGEGGGELAKQLVGRTYDIARPETVGVYLTGKPQAGVGPQDVALAIIGAVYQNGYVKNKVMEFIGPGVANLPVEYRNGIDVMTTETTCWSSIWQTDDLVQEYLAIHGRPEAYKKLAPADVAYYDGMAVVDLAKIEPMIALPFHPSNTYTIRELQANAADIFANVEKEAAKAIGIPGIRLDLLSKIRSEGIYTDQGLVAGCAGGTFDNLMAVSDILSANSIGNGAFTMSVYPGSQPIYKEMIRNGAAEKIISAGALVRSAFCGPCFGAGDTPANGAFSIRHTTRNFPNREGSKPLEGQMSSVALMDARSIAATAINGGKLTSAFDIDSSNTVPKYYFDKSIYEKRVYNGTGKAAPETQLVFGPNIKDWPDFSGLSEHLLIKVACYITDPVTTTDELIPSGETSAYRSNPERLSAFTLSRKDPEYVGRAAAIQQIEQCRASGGDILADPKLEKVYEKIKAIPGCEAVQPAEVVIGSSIYAHKPGDGSAREQAASCQRVLGGRANLAREYATKRYRSNLINWGILPFLTQDDTCFQNGDYIFFYNIREAILKKAEILKGYVINSTVTEITVTLGSLTDSERQILVDGCLINYYRKA